MQEVVKDLDGNTSVFYTAKEAYSYLALLQLTDSYWNNFDVYFKTEQTKL